jgi:hypothetical protein
MSQMNPFYTITCRALCLSTLIPLPIHNPSGIRGFVMLCLWMIKMNIYFHAALPSPGAGIV